MHRRLTKRQAARRHGASIHVTRGDCRSTTRHYFAHRCSQQARYAMSMPRRRPSAAAFRCSRRPAYSAAHSHASATPHATTCMGISDSFSPPLYGNFIFHFRSMMRCRLPRDACNTAGSHFGVFAPLYWPILNTLLPRTERVFTRYDYYSRLDGS